MSKTPAKQSKEASGLPAESYVYDFLYHDARRVGSFLSQLGKYGHLQSLTHRQSSGEGISSRAAISGSGGVPGVGSAGATGEDEETQHHDQGLETSYDPLWSNALDLYEELDKRKLIKRDVTTSGIGQFVLVSGTLSIIDLKVLQKAWKAPSVKKLMAAGIPKPDQSLPPAQRAQAKQASEQNTALMFDMLPIMPHLVQANINDGKNNTWATLSDYSLVTSAEEIGLRHGTTLSGTWNMLGILDAVPGGDGDEKVPGLDITIAQLSSIAAFGSTPIGQAAIAFGPMTRTMMGRPSTSFAMTPILIFREVSGG